MVKYRVKTDSASEPLDLATVRMHLKNEGITIDDDLLELYISAARQLCEQATNTSIISKVIEQSFDEFPSYDVHNPLKALKLAVSPLLSVSSVTYKDGNGDSQTWSSDNWEIDTIAQPGLIAPKIDLEWPETANVLNAVVIEYSAGYADANSVPKYLKQAMLLAIGHWYRKRIDSPRSLPTQVDYILQSYRVSEF